MNFNERIEEMKSFQNYVLSFLNNDEQSEESYQNICELLAKHNFVTDTKELKPFISILRNIFSNHHRSPNFYEKIFRIFNIFLENLKQIYSNFSIFKLFNKDKRILLFLIEKGVLTIDNKISDIMTKGKYKNDYFYPEYFNLSNSKNDDGFNEKRQLGENDDYICALIRNDSVEDFIIFVNQNNIDIKNFTIKSSIFETNSFLLKNKNIKLIEYTSFYGSIQIFKYLVTNGAEFTKSLWKLAIHSNNAELIQILEEKKISEEMSFYEKCLKEAIKCHHNEIAEYIQTNFFGIKRNVYKFALHYYNFEFFSLDFKNVSKFFIFACKYGHFYIVEHLLSICQISKNKINDSSDEDEKEDEEKEEEEGKDLVIDKQKLMMTIFINYELSCPYKGELNDQTISVIHEEDKALKTDWTGWYYMSKESRELTKMRIRNNYKSKYDSEKISALHFAVENEDVDIIKLLINRPEIDINKKLIRYYQSQVSSFSMNDDKREEKTSLHIAVEKGNLEIVKLLCSNENININDKTMDAYPSTDDARERKTPIHIAIENNNYEIVEFLLMLPKIKINLISTYEKWWNGGKEEYEEKTPLNFAAETGNLEIFKILLSHPKIRVNKELIEFYTMQNLLWLYKRKETSLLIAIDKKHYEIVKLLLENKKTDINALSILEYRALKYKRKKQFKTPLFLAVENNDKQMVELLLSYKKIDIKNGLMNIGGGPKLDSEKSIGIYDPYKRKDKNKPIKPKSVKGLNYLNQRRDNYDENGSFSRAKTSRNKQKYIKMTEEEDIDDDFDFNYRIFKIMSVTEAAETIGNNNICQLIKNAFSEREKNEHCDEDEKYEEVDYEIDEEEDNKKDEEEDNEEKDYFFF